MHFFAVSRLQSERRSDCWSPTFAESHDRATTEQRREDSLCAMEALKAVLRPKDLFSLWQSVSSWNQHRFRYQRRYWFLWKVASVHPLPHTVRVLLFNAFSMHVPVGLGQLSIWVDSSQEFLPSDAPSVSHCKTRCARGCEVKHPSRSVAAYLARPTCQVRFVPFSFSSPTLSGGDGGSPSRRFCRDMDGIWSLKVLGRLCLAKVWKLAVSHGTPGGAVSYAPRAHLPSHQP